ncbi:hypothetical protein HMPREF2526_06000 [Corynebacterium sp. HMSC070E08]|nr:hypothetical protein HMPREF2526_06000 [Corynebacterium sp. HMSC070E08]
MCEYAGFHIDPVFFVEVTLNRRPLIEHVYPLKFLLPYRFLRFMWFRGVPVTQTGFRVIRPTTGVIIPIGSGPRVVGAVGAV